MKFKNYKELLCQSSTEEFWQELEEAYIGDNIDRTAIQGTKLDCILDKMLKGELFNDPSSNNGLDLVQKLLRRFSGDDIPIKFEFQSNSIPDGKWAKTIKNNDVGGLIIQLNQVYLGDTSFKTIEAVTTILHELMHANMLADFDSWGILTWQNNGTYATISESLCYNEIGAIPNFAIFPSKITGAERTKAEEFAIHYCRWLQEVNGGNTKQWHHDVFETYFMDDETYRNALKDYLVDYLSSDNNLQGETIWGQTLGDNWKEIVAEKYSWVGLTSCTTYINLYVVPNSGYQNDLNSYPNYVTDNEQRRLLGKAILNRFVSELDNYNMKLKSAPPCP